MGSAKLRPRGEDETGSASLLGRLRAGHLPKLGDRVVAWTDADVSGGLAEFAVAPASACTPLSAALSAAEGVAIPTAGTAAWHALFSTAGLKAGETVLIHAG